MSSGSCMIPWEINESGEITSCLTPLEKEIHFIWTHTKSYLFYSGLRPIFNPSCHKNPFIVTNKPANKQRDTRWLPRKLFKRNAKWLQWEVRRDKTTTKRILYVERLKSDAKELKKGLNWWECKVITTHIKWLKTDVKTTKNRPQRT